MAMDFNLHSTMVLLIPVRPIPAGWWISYLHSTMVLLIPFLIKIPCACPLYLHSTMVLLIHRSAFTTWMGWVIYIPLWFYLYDGSRNVVLESKTFTFHYGSTYTISPSVSIAGDITFTFHYGSTYTVSALSSPVFAIYLHSTMVLLIRITALSSSVTPSSIYIPLWFYLYSKNRSD